MDKNLIPLDEEPEVLPPDHLQTLEDALGISSTRHMELTWMIDEICVTEKNKAGAIKKLAESNTTPEEKVYLGYYLCRKYISALPIPLRNIVLSRT